MTPTLVIAEAGVNHNGRLALALDLVDAAAKAGADIVKFQTFRADALASKHAEMAAYQKTALGGEGPQVEMLRALELGLEDHQRLMARCRERGIEFLSTPFDHQSLAMLTDELGLQRLKIGSGDMTNAPLLLQAARSRRPIILSTGMADLAEIEISLGVLAYGYRGGDGPSRRAFAEAFASAEGQALLRKNVTLLQCTTEYPAPAAEINLRAMATLSRRFGLRVGFSDHSAGIAVPLAAVALGAEVIEKHLTLDRTMPGPDHQASIEPAEFAAMVAGIRQIELALGDGKKRATESEIKNIPIARKSLVAARSIARGEVFTAENLAVKRPGDGLDPLAYWDLLGRPASSDYRADDLIDEP